MPDVSPGKNLIIIIHMQAVSIQFKEDFFFYTSYLYQNVLKSEGSNYKN